MTMTMASSEPQTRPETDGTTPPRRRQWLLAAAMAVVVVAGMAAWSVHRHSGIGSAPYTDPASAGGLTFCRDGKPVTRGSTKDPRLAAEIVSGQRPTGAFARGGTASLFAYQPRQGIAPVSWSGLQMTGATAYPAGASPTVRPAANTTSLAQFVNGYPATDGGWIQLRVVLGAPDTTAQTTAYATADLHIDGTTWTVTDPGHATCPTS